MTKEYKMCIGGLVAIILATIFLLFDFSEFILDLFFLHFDYSYKNYEIANIIIVIVEIAIAVVGFWICFHSVNIYNKKNKIKEEEELKILEAKRAKAKAKYDSDLADMETQYGMIANKISLVENSLEHSILIFHDTKNVWIYGNMYPYSNILSCSVSDNKQIKKGKIQYETSTSTGSMLGRAIFGGILTGGIGAIIGAATAGKDTTATPEDDKIIHDYTIIVNTNNISNPVIRIACGEDEVLTNNIVGLINAVISHKR